VAGPSVVGLEFPAGQLAESDYWREQFQTISEDVSVRSVHSVHYRFHDNVLYKSTFFTYLQMVCFGRSYFRVEPTVLTVQKGSGMTFVGIAAAQLVSSLSFITFFTLPFSDLSLVRLVLDLVD